MFVSSSRYVAYDFYKQLIKLRHQWAEPQRGAEGAELTEKEQQEFSVPSESLPRGL